MSILTYAVLQMNAAKLRRLRAPGWKIGSTRNFLRLTDEEAMLVELKVSLAGALKQTRQKHRLSQVDLALRMGSSQSRVAKVEAGDPSVSLDLIATAVLAICANSHDVMQAVLSHPRVR